MKVLADTHALVWAFTAPTMLGANARVLLSDDVVASVASLWELCVKAGKRTALVSDPIAWWDRHVNSSGLPTLSIREADVRALASMGTAHKDPFDRILVARAMVEGLPLVTKDKTLAIYGIQTIW